MTKPIHEMELTTAHSVRLIRPCEHCKGTGMRDDMIQAGVSGQPYNSEHTAAGTPIKYFFHPQCYVAKFGFRRATKLPASERARFRVKDVSARQMRRLLELAHDTAQHL